MDVIKKETPGWFWPLMTIIFVAGVLVAIATPNFTGGGPSKTSYVGNNLRQIDGAKYAWASEHGFTNDDQIRLLTDRPTEKDLEPYLYYQGRSFVVSGWGEVYTAGPMNRSPEARLTRNMAGLPKGTVVRFADTNSSRLECVLPDGTKQFR
ncbi:MAG TPA: hypothetical protein VN625_10130 [Desulfuromonadaceae bacterium]|nr:hypothetical protein [Desulfuromonadaceae bacterium]